MTRKRDDKELCLDPRNGLQERPSKHLPIVRIMNEEIGTGRGGQYDVKLSQTFEFGDGAPGCDPGRGLGVQSHISGDEKVVGWAVNVPVDVHPADLCVAMR